MKLLDRENRLIPALEYQAEREKDVKARAVNMSHLAQHEIMQMFEIDPAPPV